MEKTAKAVTSNRLTGYEDRPYTGEDVATFLAIHELSVAQSSLVFGMVSAGLIGRWIREKTELPVPVQVLLRLYLRYPESIPIEPKVDPIKYYNEELGGEHNLHVRYFAPLFGVDRNSGARWGVHTRPHGLVSATMSATKRIRRNNNLSQIQLLELLVGIQNELMEMLGVNPMVAGGSWHRNPPGIPIQPVTLEEMRKPVMRGRKPAEDGVKRRVAPRPVKKNKPRVLKKRVIKKGD